MGWMYALLDLPTGIRLIRKNLSGLDVAPAFFLFLVFAALLLPLTWFLWTFDLGATWQWTEPWRNAMLNSTTMDDVAFFAAVFVWIFNLTPTLIEMSFPKVARGIPAIAMALKIAIGFDYVTDWPKMWETIGEVQWFYQFPDILAFALRFLACAIGTLFVSMGLQVIVCLLAVSCLYLFLSMAGGNKGEKDRVVVVER